MIAERARRTLALFLLLLVLLAACTPPNSTSSLPTATAVPASLATAAPTQTVRPSPTSAALRPSSTPLPTPQATLALFDPLNPPRPDEVSLEGITSFALLPGNTARGEPAPDFSARLMGGGMFTLSEHRGTYWLVLPTAIGCGECMFSLNLLTQVAPESGGNLQVLVLDIYQPDQPEYWQSYADLFGNPPFLWSVLDTPTFLEDYQVFGLGSFLVIDPDGKLVFRSDSPPRLEYIAHMFTLTQAQGAE